MRLTLRKALLLNKLSRLEVERLRQPELSDDKLEFDIRQRGIDYPAMVKHDKLNREFQKKVESAFTNYNIETKSVTRLNYSKECINWSDAIFPVGGDGTFLLAASRVLNRNKPVIGFNSDPCRSEGHLCLPKKFSHDISSALHKLISGDFKWLFRTRVRVLLAGDNLRGEPVELHDQAFKLPLKDMAAEERKKAWHATQLISGCRILPVLALNEVFVGEILSAKVSYFEVKVNGAKMCTRVKSSGICICTGTGSTSWHLSMNRFSEKDVREILKLYLDMKGTALKESFVNDVCSRFNNNFIFHPEEENLGYTIRDLIYAGVWPKPKGLLEPRGFAKRLEIKSRCTDAGMAIDGGVSFPFNDGTIAVFQTLPEDALRTVTLE